MGEEKKEEYQLDKLKDSMAIGEIFAKSGMFPDVKTQAQAAVKILAGKEIGLTPFEAMSNLYIVNGRLAIMANAMASKLKKSQTYDYQIVSLTNEECIISFFFKNGDKKEVGQSTFTIKDAAKAGIVNKDNWKSYPRNMLFARALANGVKWFCPDAISGYSTYEELQDLPTEQKIIEITPEGEIKKDGETTISE